jgi:phosphatidylserine/phosphatidylglycerophosphate/cardiolipin synthase-like enzyme
VSDIPGKNEDKAERKGGATSDTLLALLKQSQHAIDIQSPYFILSDETTPVLKEAINRGVKIRLLTNSMCTTDNFEAFSGYRRDRKRISELGIQIFEFKKNANVRYKLMVEDIQKKNNYKAVYGFHPKTFIFDKKIAIVGSYNFDPRSANYNTECFLVIRSEEFVKDLLRVQEEEFSPDNAWPVTSECNPDHKAGFRKRFKVFTRRVIPKKLL